MVSNKCARKHKVLLERVLESESPTEKDLVRLFGGDAQYDFVMSGKSESYRSAGMPSDRMMEIAHQLTPSDCMQSGAKNYANAAYLWQQRNLPRLKEEYAAKNSD
ncbi:hypothetical protein ISS07_05765 [Candidatus Woesearchaeota archaeon]|nr:hypothetical protein [Candidatus Woesearchaeota archaeon]